MSGDGPPPALVLVAAVAENGVIGADGGMPWHLPTDLRHFRAVTMGKPVVMGRKTFESIGRPLPGRHNVVVTRDPDFAPEGVEVAHDLDAALALAGAAARRSGADEVAVVGGGAIYQALIGRADRLYLTRVMAAPDGDTRFPPLDPGVWRLVGEERPPRDERDSAPVVFAVYDRTG